MVTYPWGSRDLTLWCLLYMLQSTPRVPTQLNYCYFSKCHILFLLPSCLCLYCSLHQEHPSSISSKCLVLQYIAHLSAPWILITLCTVVSNIKWDDLGRALSTVSVSSRHSSIFWPGWGRRKISWMEGGCWGIWGSLWPNQSQCSGQSWRTWLLLHGACVP